MRILVTGSRDWDNWRIILGALANIAWDRDSVGAEITLVHGACLFGGADAIANDIAQAFGWEIEPHLADWQRYGKAAGFIRNQEMVDAGAGICLAFIRNNSRGATDCAARAERAGIPVRRYLAA